MIMIWAIAFIFAAINGVILGYTTCSKKKDGSTSILKGIYGLSSMCSTGLWFWAIAIQDYNIAIKAISGIASIALMISYVNYDSEHDDSN